MKNVSQSFIISQLGLVPSRPMRAGDKRQLIRHRRLAEQRLGDTRAQPFAPPR